MNHLALAPKLRLSEEGMRKIVKESLQSLCITALEYFRLPRSYSGVSDLVTAEGHEWILERAKQGKPIVFFSGHQANWEVSFIYMSHYIPLAAIGRPISNSYLYRWIVSLREMSGGKIFIPKKGLNEALRMLSRGASVGLVADQSFIDSSYSYPLLGTRAWSNISPALLAYRSGSPLCMATTERLNGKYKITFSPPLEPRLDKSLREEVYRLMDEAYTIYEASLIKNPGQWLWLHRRWKQKISFVAQPYRYDKLLIVLDDSQSIDTYRKILEPLRKCYIGAFITIFCPECWGYQELLAESEHIPYGQEDELYLRDWSYQLLFDFTCNKKLQRFYCSLGVQKVVDFNKMCHLAKKKHGDYDWKKEPEKLFPYALYKSC